MVQFQLLYNGLCRSFLVIFTSWLTCKLPHFQQQTLARSAWLHIWKTAGFRAAREASTRCHISCAPEMGWVLISDCAGWKGGGHGLVGTSKKGTKLLDLYCSRSISIEKLSELQTKSQPCFLDRQRDKQTDSLLSHPPPITDTWHHGRYQLGCRGLNIWEKDYRHSLSSFWYFNSFFIHRTINNTAKLLCLCWIWGEVLLAAAIACQPVAQCWLYSSVCFCDCLHKYFIASHP